VKQVRSRENRDVAHLLGISEHAMCMGDEFDTVSKNRSCFCKATCQRQLDTYAHIRMSVKEENKRKELICIPRSFEVSEFT
jgi:hypothetical protein